MRRRSRWTTDSETFAFPADLTRTEDANRLVEAVVARLGRLEQLTDEDWVAALQLKFLGYARSVRAALPHMRRQGKSRVINLIGNDGVKPSY